MVGHLRTEAHSISKALAEVFGESQPEVLGRSRLFAPSAQIWGERVRFCGETSQSRVICVSTTNEKLQVVVEPTEGRLDLAFQAAWEGVQRALAGLAPRLEAAHQIDEATGQTIQEGSVGIGAELRQKDVYLPVTLALVSIVWVATGLLTWVTSDALTFAGGALTTVVAGIVALVSMVVNASRRKLRWNGMR